MLIGGISPPLLKSGDIESCKNLQCFKLEFLLDILLLKSPLIGGISFTMHQQICIYVFTGFWTWKLGNLGPISQKPHMSMIYIYYIYNNSIYD